jgi:hypothetical protein
MGWTGVLMWSIASPNFEQAAEDWPGLLDPCVVQLNEEGAAQSFGENEDEYRWLMILEVHVSPEGVYFYPGATWALFVPRRAFSSEAEMASFAAEAEALWRRAVG